MCLVGKPGILYELCVLWASPGELMWWGVLGCAVPGIPGHHGVPEAFGQCMDCIGGVAAAALLGDVVPRAHLKASLGPPPPVKWPGAGGGGGGG